MSKLIAELNNEEIRSTLQDLVSSPDFNINDPDTKKQLNNILNQINIYNYLNHNKNYVGIRCLSKEEHDKYLINGTCDGSITANNQNVWNYKNIPGISFLYNYNSGNWAHYKQYTKNPNNVMYLSGGNAYNYIHDEELYFEICSNNNNDNFIAIGQSEAQYDCYFLDMDSRVNISAPLVISKIVYAKKNEGYLIITNIPDNNRQLKLTIRLHVDCFRPTFFYIDNNKSKNIYY